MSLAPPIGIFAPPAAASVFTIRVSGITDPDATPVPFDMPRVADIFGKAQWALLVSDQTWVVQASEQGDKWFISETGNESYAAEVTSDAATPVGLTFDAPIVGEGTVTISWRIPGIFAPPSAGVPRMIRVLGITIPTLPAGGLILSYAGEQNGRPKFTGTLQVGSTLYPAEVSHSSETWEVTVKNNETDEYIAFLDSMALSPVGLAGDWGFGAGQGVPIIELHSLVLPPVAITS
jgi:hypothetical protein